MTAPIAILVVLIGAGLIVMLLDHVGPVETYTISTRDFPNVIAEREAAEAAPLPCAEREEAA